MGAAHLRVIDFDGFVLDPLATGTCYGQFLVDFDIAAQFPLEAVLAEAPGDFPNFVRGDPQDRVIPLHIIVRPGATPAATQARIDALKAVFSPFRPEAYLEVVDEAGNSRRMLVKSLGLTPWEEHSSDSYVASLQAAEPIWEEAGALAHVDFALISGSGAAGFPFGITNNGNVRTYPEIRLTGNVAKPNTEHYRNLWRPIVAWRSPLQGIDSQGLPYPVDIFDGTWDTATEVGAGRMRTGCDDVRVFVDDVEVDRYIERPNTTGTSLWCSIPFEAARSATVIAMSPTSPNNGEDLEATSPEGTTGFPDVGALLIEDEAIYYRARSPTAFLNITRGWLHTTPAAHAVDTPVYFVEHDIIVVTNYTSPTPLERADRRPIIDLPASSNRLHSYGSDGFYEASQKTGQWLQELRGTNIGAAMMAMEQAAGVVTIADSAPTAGEENFDSLSLYAPCFVSPLVTGTVFDYEVDHDMLLRLYSIDAEGFEQLERWRDIRGETIYSDHYIGPPSYQNGVQHQPSGRLSRLTLQATNMRITGVVEAGVDETSIPTGDSANEDAQSFALAAAGQVKAWHFRALRDDGSTSLLTSILRVFRSSVPETQVGRSVTLPSPGVLPTGTITDIMDVSIFQNDAPWVGAPSTARGMVPADTYAVIWQHQAGAGSYLIGATASNAPIYSGGSRWGEVASAWTEEPGRDYKACLLGETATQQADAEVGSGRTVRFRNVDVHLHEDYVPQCALGDRQDCYFIEATIENQTTGQTLTILAPLELIFGLEIGMLVIYCPEHRVMAVQQSTTPSSWQARPAYVEPDDLEDWMHLAPGVNSLVYTEPSLGSGGEMYLRVYSRARWT